MIWQYNTAEDGESAQFHGEPLLVGETLIVPTDADPESRLYSFEVQSGKPRWKVPFPLGVSTTPLLVRKRAVIVSATGVVAAIEPANGRVLWKTSPAGSLQPTPFVLSPASIESRIFFADNLETVFCLEAANGKTVWQTSLSGRPNTALVAAGRFLIVGTLDGFLNWLDSSSGKVARQLPLDGYPYGTLVMDSTTLFVLVNGETAKLVAVNVESGAVLWERESKREWSTYRPLVAGSVVIVGNGDEGICAFNRTDGSLRWRRPVDGVPRGLGISSSMLYVGSLSGTVKAYRLGNSDIE